MMYLLLGGHPFMTSTKNDQFFNPPPSYPHHPQKWTTDLLLKNNGICKHVTNFPFRVDVINVWSLIIIFFIYCVPPEAAIQRCSPVNLMLIFKTLLRTYTSEWLLLHLGVATSHKTLFSYTSTSSMSCIEGSFLNCSW